MRVYPSTIGFDILPVCLQQCAEGQRGRCEDGTGAFTAREQQDHTGCLYAGSGLQQAGRTKQGCKDDDSQRGSESG